jgi:hypothetical protein
MACRKHKMWNSVMLSRTTPCPEASAPARCMCNVCAVARRGMRGCSTMTGATQAPAQALPRYGHHIGGREVPPLRGRYLPTDDPYTGQWWAEIAQGCEDDVHAAVSAAQHAFAGGPWPALTASERGPPAVAPGDLVTAHAGRLAEIEQRDNGKLAAEVVAAGALHGRLLPLLRGPGRQGAKRVIPTDKPGRVRLHALRAQGRGGIITPWNSPLTLTSWKLAPALAAGCTAVVKPSEYTSASMVEFARLFGEAGFPQGRGQRRHRPGPGGRRRWSSTRTWPHRLHRRLRGRAAASTNWPRAASRR